jgi:hypothetical protein
MVSVNSVRKEETMKDTSCAEDWRSLCEQAAKKSDPQRLLELIAKINRALEESHQRSRTDEISFKVDTVLLQTSRSSQYEFDLYRLPGECSMALEYDC